MKRLVNTVLAAAGAMALLAAPASALASELVTNGSFEKAPSGNSILPGGDSSISGWTTINEGVEWFTGGTYGTGPAHDGDSMVDLAWYTSSGTPGGGIKQTFATTPGGTYRLSFYGINANFAGRDGTGVVNALIDGNPLASFSVVRVAPTWGSISDWQYFSKSFVAAGASTTLSFTNTQNAYEHFAVIDSVSVTGGVPEPATWALMIGGFGLTGAALRRRRTAVAA